VRQWRFEIFNKPGFSDVHGASVLDDIAELGISSVQAVQSAKVFLIEADFDKDFATRVANELLVDPVCEQYYMGRSGAPAGLAKATIIDDRRRRYGRQGRQRADRTKVRSFR
jgi:phosphoribosylformylglycinamidine (FGAM) synthase PurS component